MLQNFFGVKLLFLKATPFRSTGLKLKKIIKWYSFLNSLKNVLQDRPMLQMSKVFFLFHQQRGQNKLERLSLSFLDRRLRPDRAGPKSPRSSL
jgi:hypothetical protein